MRRITVAGARRRLSRYGSAIRAAAIEYLEDGVTPWRPRTSPIAADFRAWVERGGGRRAAEFPDQWRARDDLPVAEPARVAVLIHVYYPELLPDLLSGVANIPVRHDIYLTNASGVSIEAGDLRVGPQVGSVVVLDVANHGRDIFPAIQVINAGLLDPYELVLKLHTKKSEWRADHATLEGDGRAWRERFVQDLVGSPERVAHILDAFAAEPNLGIVTAAGNVVGSEHWGGDRPIVAELLRRAELDLEGRNLRFAAGSMYWVRGFVLQGLRALSFGAVDFEREPLPVDGTTAHAVERVIGLLAQEAGFRIADVDGVDGAAGGALRFARDALRVPRARVVPFYLPQFHPTPENDRWWGAGFTEWTNVSAARPVYRGHHQPRLPSELGFYDLRLDDVRDAQAALAAEHGVNGFMYYYYWFAGRRLLSKPIESLLASTTTFPFCLMWANENWTRRWDGRNSDILIGQDYDRVPAADFIDDVMPMLRDDRYLRVDGKAVLAVYRIGQLPDVRRVIESWRIKARAAGVGGLLILAVDVAKEFDGVDALPEDAGLDGTLGFPPHNLSWSPGPASAVALDRRFRGNFMSYPALVDEAIGRLAVLRDDVRPGIMVNFDNTARRQWESDLWYGSNPYTFRRWAAAAVSAVAHKPFDERLVFVNAWNEWAEGAILEPTDRFGRSYLQALRDALYS